MNKRNTRSKGLTVIILLIMAGFAMVPSAEAATYLFATSTNINALYTMTYTQPDPSYIPWAPYRVSGSGVYKGDLLKWSYSGNLDVNNKRSVTINTYWGPLAGTNMADRDGNYYGQCVSFVKNVAHNSVVTNSWRSGANVVRSVQPLPSPINRGLAIVKFNSDGTYDCCGSGHVAIFDKYYYENGVVKGIWVWDQNYVYGCAFPCTSGLVGHHMISITNTGSTADAAAYYAVTTP